MTETLDHRVLVTLMTAISAGIGMIVLARKHRLPAIALLLVSGVLLGPQGVGIVQPDSLGKLLPVFVSLAVGLILFEGGLSLDVEGYRSASVLIRRMLTVGVLVTWLVTALAVHLIAGLPVPFALLAASLVIVTGPTVIAPLLKRIRVKESLHSILTWEAVLIDPIGVFIAVLCFEWIVRGSGEAALTYFALRVACGLAVGMAGGLILHFLLRKKAIPEDLITLSVLAGSVLTFGMAEILLSEAGLLATIVAGLVLGARRPEELKQIRRFKAEISELMIGILFMLLASRLRLSQFQNFGMSGALTVAIVLFVARPLNIALCSMGTTLPWRERVFLGWIAPRGIVAASMASLVRLTLEQQASAKEAHPVSKIISFFGFSFQPQSTVDAAFIETFTYSVIVSTILLHGLTAGPLARALRLSRTQATGWLIVGAHRMGREMARFISQSSSLPAWIVDSDKEAARQACSEGAVVLVADARNTLLIERVFNSGVGNVLAMTDNEDLNTVICQRWSEIVGRDHVYRWNSGKGEAEVERENPGRIIWPGLPKPGVLSAQISRGEASLVVSEADAELPCGVVALAAVNGALVLLDPQSPAPLPVRQHKVRWLLGLRRSEAPPAAPVAVAGAEEGEQ